MRVFSYKQVGAGKSQCEDSILMGGTICGDGFSTTTDMCHIVAVADGVGGTAGGYDASSFIVGKLSCIPTACDLRSSVKSINQELLLHAQLTEGKKKMATTLSCINFQNGMPVICHIGNTRIYAIQGMYLKQLTSDHTTYQMLLQRGDLEAAESAPKNEIIGCLGGGDAHLSQQLQSIELDREYAGYLLTSDGIHDYLDDEILEDFILDGDFTDESMRNLCAKACHTGSMDDKSIVIVLKE